MRGKKNILPRNILGKKYLALHFYRKKISVLFPWAEKKFLHRLNLPTPSKIKWSAPKVTCRQRQKHQRSKPSIYSFVYSFPNLCLDFEFCKHNSPPCKAIVHLWQFDKLFILPNGQIIDTFTQVRNDIFFICVLQQKCSLSLHLT
jgi:hypothetical protein